MPKVALSFIFSMLSAVLFFAQTGQTRSASPASADSTDLEFFLEDELADGWTYEALVDDFTDEVKHFAEIHASEGKGLIWIICFEDSGNVEIRVSTGLFLDTEEDQFDEKPVRYRVDKLQAVSDRWPGHDFIASAWEPKSLRFSRDLMVGSREVLVELTSWDGDRQRARFPLRNAREAIGKVLRSCGKPS